MKAIIASLLLGAAIPSSAPAIAQPAPAAVPVNGRKVAAAMRALLDKYYILPELRAKFDTKIDASLTAGRYDVANPDQLLDRLNEDLRIQSKQRTNGRLSGLCISLAVQRDFARAFNHTRRGSSTT